MNVYIEENFWEYKFLGAEGEGGKYAEERRTTSSWQQIFPLLITWNCSKCLWQTEETLHPAAMDQDFRETVDMKIGEEHYFTEK